MSLTRQSYAQRFCADGKEQMFSQRFEISWKLKNWNSIGIFHLCRSKAILRVVLTGCLNHADLSKSFIVLSYFTRNLHYGITITKFKIYLAYQIQVGTLRSWLMSSILFRALWSSFSQRLSFVRKKLTGMIGWGDVYNFDYDHSYNAWKGKTQGKMFQIKQ